MLGVPRYKKMQKTSEKLTGICRNWEFSDHVVKNRADVGLEFNYLTASITKKNLWVHIEKLNGLVNVSHKDNRLIMWNEKCEELLDNLS